MKKIFLGLLCVMCWGHKAYANPFCGFSVFGSAGTLVKGAISHKAFNNLHFAGGFRYLYPSGFVSPVSLGLEAAAVYEQPFPKTHSRLILPPTTWGGEINFLLGSTLPFVSFVTKPRTFSYIKAGAQWKVPPKKPANTPHNKKAAPFYRVSGVVVGGGIARCFFSRLTMGIEVLKVFPKTPPTLEQTIPSGHNTPNTNTPSQPTPQQWVGRFVIGISF